jgi:hypothetical protein
VVPESKGAPHPRVSVKGAESYEKKRVDFLAGAKNCKEMQKSAEESERKGVKKLRLEKKGRGCLASTGAEFQNGNC